MEAPLHARIRELEARVARLEKQRQSLAAHLMALAPDGSGGRYCGCYILWRDAEAVYVGQSTNVLSRVGSHRSRKEPPIRGGFDGAYIVWCNPDELNATEQRLIEELQPQFNRAGRRRHYIGRRPSQLRAPAAVLGPEFAAQPVGSLDAQEHGHA